MIKKYLDEFLGAWVVILILNQLFIFGCFKLHCILAGLPHTGILAFLYILFVVKPKDEEEEAKRRKEKKPIAKEEATPKKPQEKASDPLKDKGDKYEKFIGQAFEKKGELVIYNGFIYGYDDKGVDVISISLQTNTINLIQCKHWTHKEMFLEDIKEVHRKLSLFNVEYITDDSDVIREHLKIDKSVSDIEEVLEKEKSDFTIRKTLYMSSDKVMNLKVGSQLTLIKPNIFRYEDMKIVIVGM